MAESMAEATSKMRPLNAPPEITEEGILQLENILNSSTTTRMTPCVQCSQLPNVHQKRVHEQL